MDLIIWFFEAVARRAPTSIQVESTRYLVGAVGTWLVVWVLLSGVLAPRKIRKPTRRAAQIRRELLYSGSTVIVFMVMGVFVYEGAAQGWFRFYSDVSDYGWVYLVLSIAGLVVFHDAYFYWTHRAMHHPKLFRAFHRVHHLSKNPTPFTAYSFDAAEAAVNFMVIPLYCMIVPTHDIATMIYMWMMIVRNAVGHCGYELMPRGWTKNPILDRFTTITHHDMHHEKMTGNYALYFTWWDRWMGTEHVDTNARFEAITEQGERTIRVADGQRA
jgi:sterol desaturase/sphingolipid hydroxylase (fatty acid hydroxylase superfamily)